MITQTMAKEIAQKKDVFDELPPIPNSGKKNADKKICQISLGCVLSEPPLINLRVVSD